MSSLTKPDYEALLAFRTALRRFLHFTEEGARSAGLTPQQHQAMLAVMGQPNRDWATIREIAEALQIRHHAAVGLVDRCEQADLVLRSVNPLDRRSVRVSLSPHGETILAHLSQANLKELSLLKSFMIEVAAPQDGAP